MGNCSQWNPIHEINLSACSSAVQQQLALRTDDDLVSTKGGDTEGSRGKPGDSFKHMHHTNTLDTH